MVLGGDFLRRCSFTGSERHALDFQKKGQWFICVGRNARLRNRCIAEGPEYVSVLAFCLGAFSLHSGRERSLAQVMVQGGGVLGGQEEAYLTGQQRGL